MARYIVLPLARPVTRDGAYLRALAITDTEGNIGRVVEYAYRDVSQVLDEIGIERSDCVVLETVELSPSGFSKRVKRGL